MTDPLEACLQELNKAVSDYDALAKECRYNGSRECPGCRSRRKFVDSLRHKYNALVIAYAERTD